MSLKYIGKTLQIKLKQDKESNIIYQYGRGSYLVEYDICIGKEIL